MRERREREQSSFFRPFLSLLEKQAMSLNPKTWRLGCPSSRSRYHLFSASTWILLGFSLLSFFLNSYFILFYFGCVLLGNGCFFFVRIVWFDCNIWAFASFFLSWVSVDGSIKKTHKRIYRIVWRIMRTELILEELKVGEGCLALFFQNAAPVLIFSVFVFTFPLEITSILTSKKTI